MYYTRKQIPLSRLLNIAQELRKCLQDSSDYMDLPVFQLIANSAHYLIKFYLRNNPDLYEKLIAILPNHIPFCQEIPSANQVYLTQDLAQLEQYLQLLKKNTIETIFQGGEYHLVFKTSCQFFLPYRIFIPLNNKNKSKKYKLIIGLHGAGYDENLFIQEYVKNDQNVLYQLAENHEFIVASLFVGSQLPFYLNRTENENNVYDFLQHLLSIFPIDRNHIFLIGHSMGCRGAWNLATDYSDFQGIAFVAGAASTSQFSKYHQFMTPMFYAYGGKDTVVKPNIAESFLEGLDEKTKSLVIRNYPEANHQSILPDSASDILEFFTNL